MLDYIAACRVDGEQCLWTLVFLCFVVFALKIVPDVWASEYGVASMPPQLRWFVGSGLDIEGDE